MAFKTISTVFTQPEGDMIALNAAADLARREEGHLDVICLGVDRTQPGFYYAGASAMAMQTNLKEAEDDARKAETAVNEALQGADFAWSIRTMTAQSAGLAQFLSYQLRFSDIAVLAQPYGEGRGYEHEAITESALFDAHIPVMVMPKAGSLSAPLDKIVVGWNESSEALRAIRAAMPLLKAASVVNVAIIDPPSHAPDRSDPGGMLSQMLSRHGVHAEVSVLAKTMPRVSDVLLRHCTDQEADMIVMGAYGHSRFRESILGGATRNMLQQASVPVFMAH